MPEIYTYFFDYIGEYYDVLLAKMFNNDLSRYAGQDLTNPDLWWIDMSPSTKMCVTEEEAIDYILQRNNYAESISNQAGGPKV